jgi:hypothetical protein
MTTKQFIYSRSNQVMNTEKISQQEFEKFLELAYQISLDVGEEVESILKEARETEVSVEESVRLLTKVLSILKESAIERGDKMALKTLEGSINDTVQAIIERKGKPMVIEEVVLKKIKLTSKNGVDPGPVQPTPCFHGVEINMNSGYVPLVEINLWDENLRLDIHLNQFKNTNGRVPSPEEVLDIMLSNLQLPGIEEDDQFEIIDLARSIAINGVRKPPIIDINGKLYDGNRRIAACHYVLKSNEFNSVEKARAKDVFVWQLTEHVTPEQIEKLVVSLNFEKDCKVDWPEYVKAKKVYDAFLTSMALESNPTPQRTAEIKRTISKNFALGPEARVVTRYIKMVEFADDFEEYQINDRKQNEFEVKHQANNYFQYFDELTKGVKPGGVQYTLNQDSAFKHLIFDLLYQGKFSSFTEIRPLNIIAGNKDARELLIRAREETDIEEAQSNIDNAIAIAKAASASARELGANTRIESFVKWLEDLPAKTFRDVITRENLNLLFSALTLVGKLVQTILIDGSKNVNASGEKSDNS